MGGRGRAGRARRMGWAVALTVTGAVLDGEPVGLRCEDGRIVEIGPGVVARPGDETIDAAGAMLVPRCSTATPTPR